MTAARRWLGRFPRTIAASVLVFFLFGLMGCVGGAAPPEVDVAYDRLAQPAPTDAGEYQLSYIRHGRDGDPRVIFVHGTPGSATTFNRFLQEGHVGLDLISIDRPGFGLTTPRQQQISLKVQAQVIEPLLVQDRNGHWPILVGHSLGGPIVAKAAALYPEKTGGIVIVAGSLDPALEKIHPLQYVGEAWPFSWLIGRTLRNSNRELLALKPELELLSSELRQVISPITIVHGTKDKLVPYENVPFMQAAFRHNDQVELVTLEGLDHFLPWNSQPVIWSAIERIARTIGTDAFGQAE